MKNFQFGLLLILTLAFGNVLNNNWGSSIPPLGKVLSPFHGFWLNAENELINIGSRIEAKVSEPVSVFYDDLLIPHIYAKNERDLFFAQGYVTAYHRLWQMEFQLLAADGRISEIIGSRALEFDRSQRRQGLGFGARNSHDFFKEQEPELYKLIQAYTEGINSYINSLDYKDLAIEYKLLNYKPEPWTTYKCFLFLSNMHQSLSGGDDDLENTNALRLWGKEIFDILYPERNPSIDPIIPTEVSFDFEPVELPPADSNYMFEFSVPFIEKADPDNGSNNFVVGPSKSSTGNVILTNEMDLGLNLPSIWYVVHLNAPGINVMGASFPGVPMVIAGFNDSIAWGETNARADVVDWYAIQFKDEKREEYLYNDNWVPTKTVIEEIKVRGESTFYDTIVFTHHGPVVYDRNFTRRERPENLAMKWLAHIPHKEFKAFYLCNKANNYKGFVDAFSNFGGPAQNFAVGCTNGDYGIYISGRFPLKWKEQGKFLLDGNNPNHEWSGFIPFEHNPSVKNPRQGYSASANQHPVDSLYPYHMHDSNYDDFRGRRINDRLRVMGDISPEDLMELQHDNFNYLASENLQFLLDSLDSASFIGFEGKYYEQLKGWDFFNEPDQEEPTFFHIWWRNLRKNLWEEIDSSAYSLIRPDSYSTAFILRNYPDLSFIDIQTTNKVETVTDLIKLSFKETIDEVEKMKSNEESTIWYQYKNTRINHLLRLDPFSIKEIKIGGGRSIVNAASSTHGPTWRMVAELDKDGVKVWGIYPGSQTGNPGNRSYGEFVDEWASGQYKQMLFKPQIDSSMDRITYTTEFTPSK